VLPVGRFPKAQKLLAIFLAFCRLAYPEVAERKAQDGLKPRLATAEFCSKFCPGLEPFMQCFRQGNVNLFRQLQQRHAESLWRLGLTVRFSLSFASLLPPLLALMEKFYYPTVEAHAFLQVLVASLETLVIRRLVICYIAAYLDATGQNKHLHSVKQMLRSPVFTSRWSDSDDARMQSVIMLFSSKLLKATVVPHKDDASDLTLAFSQDRVWPNVLKAKGKKK
jgi:hypothetical protein